MLQLSLLQTKRERVSLLQTFQFYNKFSIRYYIACWTIREMGFLYLNFNKTYKVTPTHAQIQNPLLWHLIILNAHVRILSVKNAYGMK